MYYKIITLFLTTLLITCCSCISPNTHQIEVSYPFQKVGSEAKETMQVLFFTSDNCPPCLRMKKNVWPNAEVRRSIKQYHCSPRMLNSSDEKDLVYFKHYNIRYVPTTIICDRYGGELKREVGYVSIKEMLHFLVQ